MTPALTVRGASAILSIAPSVEPPFSGLTVDQTVAAVPLALALAAIHLFAGRLRFLDTVPRSRLLSLFGGVSVSYVFVHALPQIEHAEAAMADGPLAGVVEELVYLIALLGFVTYYGLERFVKRSRTAGREEDRRRAGREEDRRRAGRPERQSDGGPVTASVHPDDRTVGDDESPPGIFWFHVGSFTVYNALIGYLLFHPESPGVGNLLVFGVAMGLHFVVNDFGLWDQHRESYCGSGRWALSLSVLLGALAGALVEVSEVLLGALFAFVAGGVILNVIKEELPEERDSRFWPFATGVAGYAALLILL